MQIYLFFEIVKLLFAEVQHQNEFLISDCVDFMNVFQLKCTSFFSFF